MTAWGWSAVAATAVLGFWGIGAYNRLMSLLEHALDLRRAAGVDALVDELKLIERQRAFARQVFNQAVGHYNTALAAYPTRVLARLYSFSPARAL